MSKEKEDLEKMLGKLHSEDGRKSLLEQLAHRVEDADACEYVAQRLVEYGLLSSAEFVTFKLGELEAERARGIHAELSRKYEQKKMHEKVAEHARSAGDDVRADDAYRYLSKQCADSDILKSAQYAVQGGDHIDAMRKYADWTELQLLELERQSIDEPEAHEKTAKFAKDFLRELDRQKFIPDVMKQRIAEDVAPTAVRKYVECGRLDDAKSVAAEYGKTDLLLGELEKKHRYQIAMKVAEESGMDELVKVYKQLF